MLLDGKKVAENIYKEIAEEIDWLTKKPCLGAVLLWEKDSPSMRYIEQKKRNAEKVGMEFILHHLAEDTSEKELLSKIQELNTDTHLSGYIVQLPLPQHIDNNTIINAIDSSKDVDGFHPINQGKLVTWDDSGFTPCTPAGIMHLLSSQNIDLTGKSVVIIGKSNIVGKPLISLCLNQWATVTSCNSKTPDISIYTKQADIVISATGMPHIITADIIGDKTVVIDVWFSIIDGKILWDSDVEAIDQQWNLVTPVPGWVWPMTVAMLLWNTLKAHKTYLWTL